MTKMGEEASTPEMDKYNLHVEEVNMLFIWRSISDEQPIFHKNTVACVSFSEQCSCQVEKITSLILGLSSRLAKTENSLANLKPGTFDEDEEVIPI